MHQAADVRLGGEDCAALGGNGRPIADAVGQKRARLRPVVHAPAQGAGQHGLFEAQRCCQRKDAAQLFEMQFMRLLVRLVDRDADRHEGVDFEAVVERAPAQIAALGGVQLVGGGGVTGPDAQLQPVIADGSDCAQHGRVGRIGHAVVAVSDFH